MQSIDLIRHNLNTSTNHTLAHIDDMREYCMTPSTPDGDGHTLWILGHLAYIEGLVIQYFMHGETNPLADWEPLFDGANVSGDINLYPAFDHVLATCRNMRAQTLSCLDSLTEHDLDNQSANVPSGHEQTFGSWRLCFQNVADHWLIHRGQLADARRAAGLGRMWV